uniref:Uncharacterized protein n=1 Tax=Nothobranchius furzeri TaxID=105023 RepID=A0A8C6LXH8_NOTFU
MLLFFHGSITAVHCMPALVRVRCAGHEGTVHSRCWHLHFGTSCFWWCISHPHWGFLRPALRPIFLSRHSRISKFYPVSMPRPLNLFQDFIFCFYSLLLIDFMLVLRLLYSESATETDYKQMLLHSAEQDQTQNEE